MDYFSERRGRRIDDKLMFIFLSLISTALVIAVVLVVYFR